MSNWSKRVETFSEDFDTAYHAIAYRGGPLAAAIALGLLYAYIIHTAIDGPLGWIIGGVSAAGLELAGMMILGIAVRKRGVWWIAAALYIITHVLTFVTIEWLDIDSFIAVGVNLVITAFLAYVARADAARERDAEAIRLSSEEKQASDQKEEEALRREKEAWESEQRRLEEDAQLERDIKRRRLEIEAQYEEKKLRAKASLEAAKIEAEKRQYKRQDTGKSRGDNVRYAHLTLEEKRRILDNHADAFAGRLAAVPQRTRRDWKSKIADEIAGQNGENHA